MDDDEFNDFQQAVQPYILPTPETNSNPEPLVEEEGSLPKNNLTISDPELMIPSSALATEYAEAPSGQSESRGLGGSPELTLSKIQSEKLTADQHVFLKLDKNYSLQDRKIGLIVDSDYILSQAGDFSQELRQKHKENLAFQQLEAKNIEPQSMKNENEYSKETVQRSLTDLEIKISSQQTHGFVEKTQQQPNNQPNEHYQVAYQNCSEAQNNNTQPQSYLEAKREENQELKAQQADEEQDQQFGDFEETLPINQEDAAQEQQPLPSKERNQVNEKQIEEPQPSRGSHFTRKQELQQFVNSLPDYSLLFAQSFHSF